MSNDNGNSNPHSYLIGAQVVRTGPGLEWTKGIIAATYTTDQGVGIHVCNPETGEVTLGVGLSEVELGTSVVKLLQTTGHMNAAALEQLAGMLS